MVEYIEKRFQIHIDSSSKHMVSDWEVTPVF